MVTDGILCAVQGMTDRFDTTEAKNAGNAIFEMLADFDEGMWEKLTNSYAVDAWLSQHIKKAFISNPLREIYVRRRRAYYKKRYLACNEYGRN